MAGKRRTKPDGEIVAGPRRGLRARLLGENTVGIAVSLLEGRGPFYVGEVYPIPAAYFRADEPGVAPRPSLAGQARRLRDDAAFWKDAAEKKGGVLRRMRVEVNAALAEYLRDYPGELPEDRAVEVFEGEGLLPGTMKAHVEIVQAEPERAR